MILLWDSSTMTVALDIIDHEGKRTHREWQAERLLARDMLSYLRTELAAVGAQFDDVSAIGAFRGPGSFTGLRIGLTVLNTLARSLAIPIVGETGERWQEKALERLQRGDDDQLVLPEYGSAAHTTTPRK